MARQSSDTVFQLIKRLSKGEKRHFKIFAQRHVVGKGNVYVRLFDLMERQKNFNEASLQKQLKLSKKQLTDSKYYLQKLILRSLSQLRNENSLEQLVKEHIDFARALNSKGLQAEAIKHLRKAVDASLQQQNNALLLESQLAELDMVPSPDEQLIEDIAAAAKRLTEEKTLLKLREETEQIFLNKGGSKGACKAVKELLKKKVKKAPKSFIALLDFYEIQMIYHLRSGSVDKALKTIHKAFDLWNSNQYFLALYPQRFLFLANNLFVALGFSGRHEEAGKLANELAFPGRNKKKQLMFQKARKQLLFRHAIDLGHTQAGYSILREYYKVDNDSSSFPKMEADDYLNIALLSFVEGDNNDALHFINTYTMLEVKEGSFNSVLAHLLGLMINYEAGDEERQAHFARALYKRISKREYPSRFEKALLNYLRTTNHLEADSDLTAHFKKFRLDLESLKGDLVEREKIERFMIDNWLDSQIETLPLSEVVKRKLEKKLSVSSQ